jgi:ubiquinone/menaquinone biosynthesis C-methylase UbiE
VISSSAAVGARISAALREHEGIRKIATTVARERQVESILAARLLRVRNGSGAIVLHLLEGRVSAPSGTCVEIPPNALWEIVRPDISRTSCGEEFAERLLTRIGSSDSADIARILATWFAVYRESACRFFGDQALLDAYFADAEMCVDWWNERSTSSAPHDAYARLLAERVNVEGKRMLDVACGFGRLSPLYGRARSVVAVDLSAEMLARARTTSPVETTDYRLRSLYSLSELDQFDVVLALQVLMHVSDLPRALARLARAVVAGGDLWIDLTCTHQPTSTGFVQETFFTRLYSEVHVLRVCDEAGLAVYSVDRLPAYGGTYWLVLGTRRQPTALDSALPPAHHFGHR